MNYKQRMIIELVDLKEKIIKLEKFEGVVTEEEGNMMKRQLDTMNAYYSVLQDRIMFMLDDCSKLTNRE